MTDKTAKQIADNLRKSRYHRDLTQSELAKKAGISTNYYARVERAEVKPTVETLERIVKALGVKSSSILPF
jgi:transcriptional regulator with XRE-family HTH domain